LYENEQLLSKWLTVVTAASLQPGELFEIVKGMTLPCDTILLSGNVICSEKFLSGESTPQTKTCLPGGRRPRVC
jgi:cation-transporting P-type ATPase 13A2